jgi:predicted dehydrogenase
VISALGNFGGPLEHWHPNADAFLMHAGPFRDVAPYPLTVMTTMIGPVKTVHGFARVAVPKRVLNQGPRQGTEFEVTEKDHGFAVLEFEVPQADGSHGFIYHSFTVTSQIPPYEIHGTKGGFSIQAHDDGRGIKKFTPQSGWQDELSPSKSFTGLDWGKGVADFADAIRNDRIPRCNGAQARHVLEVCERVIESSDLGKPVDVSSRFPAPPAVGEVAPWETSYTKLTGFVVQGPRASQC